MRAGRSPARMKRTGPTRGAGGRTATTGAEECGGAKQRTKDRAKDKKYNGQEEDQERGTSTKEQRAKQQESNKSKDLLGQCSRRLLLCITFFFSFLLVVVVVQRPLGARAKHMARGNKGERLGVCGEGGEGQTTRQTQETREKKRRTPRMCSRLETAESTRSSNSRSSGVKSRCNTSLVGPSSVISEPRRGSMGDKSVKGKPTTLAGESSDARCVALLSRSVIWERASIANIFWDRTWRWRNILRFLTDSKDTNTLASLASLSSWFDSVSSCSSLRLSDFRLLGLGTSPGRRSLTRLSYVFALSTSSILVLVLLCRFCLFFFFHFTRDFPSQQRRGERKARGGRWTTEKGGCERLKDKAGRGREGKDQCARM